MSDFELGLFIPLAICIVGYICVLMFYRSGSQREEGQKHGIQQVFLGMAFVLLGIYVYPYLKVFLMQNEFYSDGFGLILSYFIFGFIGLILTFPSLR